MASKTNIEWTATYHEDGTVTKGFNWNFLRGCSRVSEGCRNCYAERDALRFSGPGQPYEGLVESTPKGPRWTGEVKFIESMLEKPLYWTKPRKIFVNSMSDLFHEKVTDEMLDKAFAVMALTPQHTYQILTKRPERMREYLLGTFNNPNALVRGFNLGWWLDLYVGEDAVDRLIETRKNWPLPNVWLGVSVEDQKTADERIPLLLETPAAVRWVSYEPALGPVDFTSIRFKNALGSMEDWNAIDRCVMPNGLDDPTLLGVDDPILNWIVVGGESGPNARPFDIAWARSVIEQCKAAGVPVFVKQLGANIRSRNDTGFDGDDAQSWPMDTDFEEHPNGYRQDWQGDPVRILLNDRKGGDPSEWPEDIRVREFPK